MTISTAIAISSPNDHLLVVFQRHSSPQAVTGPDKCADLLGLLDIWHLGAAEALGEPKNRKTRNFIKLSEILSTIYYMLCIYTNKLLSLKFRLKVILRIGLGKFDNF